MALPKERSLVKPIHWTLSLYPNNDELQSYIVGWNDHSFILEVEVDAYHIIA